jgi:glucosamine 6-phosphate synthetase-like amidotransferase/phosphosugar isomerase protein
VSVQKLTQRSVAATKTYTCHLIAMRFSAADLYSAIPYIIPGQLLAAKLSLLKGLSPDRPRSLAKITKTL